jgi:nucleoside-diphosphate-sugar epimerase
MEYGTSKYSYHKVSVLSLDFDSLFTDTEFDVCINAAGSGNVGFSLAHPQSDFDGNTAVVVKVLDTIRRYQPGCRVLHISSAAVYGNPVRLPIPETAAMAPLSPYGFHKYMSEIACREYSVVYKVRVAILRPFSVYGNGLKKQLLWDICQKLQQDDSIQLFGSGNETRDFIHIDDLLQLMHLLIIKGNFDGVVYNAATGIETSIRTIADLFEQNFAAGKKISFSGNSRAGDPTNWRADISSVTKLGFKPARQFETTLTEYINWFRNTQS